jgi:transposase
VETYPLEIDVCMYLFKCMFIRRKNIRKNGKIHSYWILVESYRTDKGVRQRTVGYIGDITRKQAKAMELSAERCDSCQTDFLSPEELPDKMEIEPKKIRTERQREFGGVWLGNKMFGKLELDDFFKRQGYEEWLPIFKILTISRFYHPSSELHIAEHLYEHSAMEDFFGIPAAKIYENRLYRGLDRLLLHKQALQEHLKQALGSLFDIKYDLFLYDVTSTYFEGEHAESELCQRGYSRDSRPDCKQICIALVVTREGLPLGYEIFSGNTHDSTTVEEIVGTMEKSYGAADRIWVMDRGMVSENNIEMLNRNGRRYIIGTPKSSLQRFEQHLLEKDWQMVHEGVEVKLCPSPDNTGEVFILCRSRDRAEKEKLMHDRFVKRIEAGIEKLTQCCERETGKDITGKIERRIGRLMQQNSRGASFFKISTRYDRQIAKTLINVERDEGRSHWKRMTEGHYLLRSNITDWDPKQLWEAYIHLTDAEEAFKINKSDLHIRPIWHQRDDRIRAHVLVCFIAFVLWKTFGQMCKRSGLGDEPRRVFNELKRISMVDVVLATAEGKEIKIRTVPRPDKPLQVLLHHLKLSLPERLTKRVL